MPDLVTTQLDDLMNQTLDSYDQRPKFQQVAQSLNSYPVFKEWFRKKRVRMIPSGVQISRALMTQLGEEAQDVGLHSSVDYQFGDHMANMTINWAHIFHYWMWELREVMMNRGESLITEVIKPREMSVWIRIAEKLEQKAWSLPNAETGVGCWLGVPYWIVYNSAAEGFANINAGSFSGKAGIDAVTVSGVRNWSYTYTTASKADLITDMREAHVKTDWTSPVDETDLRSGSGRDLVIYTDYTTIAALETIGENQNENLGRDIASMDGMITFRRHKVVREPYLDDNAPTGTTNPLYHIDHNTWQTCVLKGDFFRPDGPHAIPFKPNSRAKHVNLTGAFVCVDPRRNAVGSK